MPQPVYLNRLAVSLPNEPVDNDAMETVLGMVGERPSRARRPVLRSNGIRQRYYVIDPATGEARYNNAELTAEAVRGLVGDGFALDDLQLLCCGTSSPDQLMPNHGVMVHGVLGNGTCEVMATAGICLSGLTAFKHAWLSIRAGECECAVATGSEVASSFMHARNFAAENEAQIAALQQRPELAFEKDFLRWMLSDGAGAALLQGRPGEPGRSLRIDFIDVFSYADHLETCMYAGAEKGADGRLVGWREFADPIAAMQRSVFAVKQDVRLLNENVTRTSVELALAEVARRRRLTPEQIDYFLPHMSSEFFRPRIAESLERIGFAIPMERWFTNLSETGNIGSASFFAILAGVVASGRLRSGQRLLAMVPESGRFSVGYVGMTVV